MLKLRRRKGESIRIGDEQLTVMDFDDHELLYRYKSRIFFIEFRKVYKVQVDPIVTISYYRREGNKAYLSINSTIPTYREEIYERMKQCPSGKDPLSTE